MNFDTFLIFLGLKGLSYKDTIWMIICLTGQLIFFSRWVVQWLASEKNSKSVIPVAFWWFSLIGGLITLFYAYHLNSFPFMLAQFIGIFIYLRNLFLIIKEKKD